MHNIILSGFAGSGKTTIGRLLAEHLGYPFVDMDWLIEARERRTIADIFAQEGEDTFRRLERSLCHEITTWRNHVVATGGGTLVDANNLALLEASNLVVCLDCAPDIVWRRVARATHRPLLAGENDAARRAKLMALMQARAPAYARIATHVDTTDRQIEAIVAEIAALWNARRHEEH